MNARANVLSGIVNGIDYEVYNPMTDKSLAANYNQITFRKEKWKNKVALQKELGLAQDKSKFMIGIVSRLTAGRYRKTDPQQGPGHQTGNGSALCGNEH